MIGNWHVCPCVLTVCLNTFLNVLVGKKGDKRTSIYNLLGTNLSHEQTVLFLFSVYFVLLIKH